MVDASKSDSARCRLSRRPATCAGSPEARNRSSGSGERNADAGSASATHSPRTRSRIRSRSSALAARLKVTSRTSSIAVPSAI